MTDIYVAVVGTVEELGTSPATINLVRDQFETNFFSLVNFIKAVLPLLRSKHTGHIILLTGITGHIGSCLKELVFNQRRFKTDKV